MITAAIVDDRVTGVPRRRWLSFSLRTLLLLLTISCVVIAWLVPQLRWIRERHRALDEFAVPNVVERRFNNYAPWSIHLLGEQGCHLIAWERTGAGDDERAAELKRLFPEAQILPMNRVEFNRHWPE